MTDAIRSPERPLEVPPLQVGQIEVLGREVAIGQAARWEPVAGSEAIELLHRKLDDAEQQREVLSSAREIGRAHV